MTSSTQPVGRHRIITTPEGLDLDLEIAAVGGRVAAFALDIFAIVILFALVPLTLWFFGVTADDDASVLLFSLYMIASFVLRNGYFLCFELYFRGMTPGKWAVGLKVVSRDGGPLTTGAVIARNLLRELEFFIPFILFVAPGDLGSSVPAWAEYAAFVWIVIFVVMPLLNRDRSRCGDLAAGTLVVTRPEGWLRTDAAEKGADGTSDAAFQFSQEQLEMYGIRELQVLEDLLRHTGATRQHARVLRTVCDKITHKIAWKGKVPRDKVEPFLRAFYRAQRGRLEQRLLMGERREKKKKGRLETP